ARLGLSVPADLSIMGYDDESHVADTLVPALTTMALPLREMGAAAMTQLLEQIEGPAKSEEGPAGLAAGPAVALETMVPCRLVVRDWFPTPAVSPSSVSWRR